MKKTIILLTVCLAPLGAQIHALKPEVRAQSPLAVQQQGLEFVLPELIVGGEWTTTLRLRNMGTAPIPNTNLYFIDNNGNPMTLNFISSSGQPTTSQGATFFLDPQASFEVTFTGGSTTQWGQAIIDLCHSTPCINGLYGEVVLRNRNATRPDFESLFPIEEPAPLQYMLFDHRNGFQTVLYLNNDSTSTLNVTLNFVDNGNRMVASVPLTMPSASSQLLNLGVIAPATNGIEGTLQIVANVAGGTGAPLLTATAIRINPSNSFTPIRSFIPK